MRECKEKGLKHVGFLEPNTEAKGLRRTPRNHTSSRKPFKSTPIQSAGNSRMRKLLPRLPDRAGMPHLDTPSKVGSCEVCKIYWYRYNGPMIDVPSLIREAREKAGLTQSDLAIRAGTSQPAVARYETGVVSPSLNTLDRLLRACGVVLHANTEAAPNEDLAGSRARLLRTRRSEIIEVLAKHGFHSPRVFGSTARTEDTDESNIDLLVSTGDSGLELMSLLRATSELSEVLGTSVELATEEILRPEIVENVKREAVLL